MMLPIIILGLGNVGLNHPHCIQDIHVCFGKLIGIFGSKYHRTLPPRSSTFSQSIQLCSVRLNVSDSSMAYYVGTASCLYDFVRRTEPGKSHVNTRFGFKCNVSRTVWSDARDGSSRLAGQVHQSPAHHCHEGRPVFKEHQRLVTSLIKQTVWPARTEETFACTSI